MSDGHWECEWQAGEGRGQMVPFDLETSLGRRNGVEEVVGSRGSAFPSLAPQARLHPSAPRPSLLPGLGAASPRLTPEAQQLPRIVSHLAEANPVHPSPQPHIRHGRPNRGASSGIYSQLFLPQAQCQCCSIPHPSSGPGSGNGRNLSFNIVYSAWPGHFISS